MPRGSKSNPNGVVNLSITLPPALVARLDELLDESREANPYATMSRSGLVAHGLSEWIELLGDPHRAPSPRHRERRP